jgi:hypothetical protein
LTALQDVKLTYWAKAKEIDRAAAGCGALPVKHLYIAPDWRRCTLLRSTLLQLAGVTHLGELYIHGCKLDNITPQELVGVLAQLPNMFKLSLSSVRWQQQQQQRVLQTAAALWPPSYKDWLAGCRMTGRRWLPFALRSSTSAGQRRLRLQEWWA